MIIPARIFFFISSVFILPSCFGIYKNHKLLAEVDNASAAPSEVFVSADYDGGNSFSKNNFAESSVSGGKIAEKTVLDKKLYFSYEDEGRAYYFAAKIPRKDSRREKRNAALEIKEAKDFNPDALLQKEEVVIAEDIFPAALEEALNIMAPKTNNSGVIIPTGLKDAVLYRDSGGAVKIAEPANVPKSVKVKGRLSRKRTVSRTYGAIIKYMRQKYPDAQKFIIPVTNIPLVPYVYVDIENETAAAVKLPDFYEVKKDVSAVGFSAGFF
ncbi:MAG: hypothetical protein LBO62_06430, partial [Endomicrobium sp.]|nr:hypothetical protein [Endomicrobium sp.]